MKTIESAKKEKISHLEFCLEKLRMRENGYNELEIKYLYQKIYHVVCEMEVLDSVSALTYYNYHINDGIRNELNKFNIELIV